MDLRTLENKELLSRTQSLVAEERRLGLEVLRHLREIERRRLHAVQGYESLHVYCVKALGYSDGAAYRRIAAMRAIQEVPDLETRIQEGALNLSSVSQAQSFFLQEKKSGKPYTLDQKKEIFQSLENQSKRQCDKILESLTDAPKRVMLHLEISPELQQKLQALEASIGKRGAELLEWLADQALKKKSVTSPEKLLPVSESRYIPAPLKRAVRKRDQGRCTYQDPQTGRRCEGTKNLHFEHIRPYALGGLTSHENLALHCFAHNQLKAIQVYGLRKMARFVPGIR